MRNNQNYYKGTKNFHRQSSHCSMRNNHNNSANIPLEEILRLSMPQCICSVRTDAVHLWKPFVPLGLFTSTKRIEPLINHRRLEMSNNTVLLTVQDRIADVSESIKFIIKNTEGESGQAGQISCLLNILSATLQDAWSDLSDYTFENNINYEKGN